MDCSIFSYAENFISKLFQFHVSQSETVENRILSIKTNNHDFGGFSHSFNAALELNFRISCLISSFVDCLPFGNSGGLRTGTDSLIIVISNLMKSLVQDLLASYYDSL